VSWPLPLQAWCVAGCSDT